MGRRIAEGSTAQSAQHKGIVMMRKSYAQDGTYLVADGRHMVGRYQSVGGEVGTVLACHRDEVHAHRLCHKAVALVFALAEDGSTGSIDAAKVTVEGIVMGRRRQTIDLGKRRETVERTIEIGTAEERLFLGSGTIVDPTAGMVAVGHIEHGGGIAVGLEAHGYGEAVVVDHLDAGLVGSGRIGLYLVVIVDRGVHHLRSVAKLHALAVLGGVVALGHQVDGVAIYLGAQTLNLVVCLTVAVLHTPLEMAVRLEEVGLGLPSVVGGAGGVDDIYKSLGSITFSMSMAAAKRGAISLTGSPAMPQAMRVTRKVSSLCSAAKAINWST